MCLGCWEELEVSPVVNDRVLACVETIKRVYEASLVGGAMHIVVDDWNLEDRHIKISREWAEKCLSGEGLDFYDAKQYAFDIACADAMEPLTIAERATALAIYEGFIDANQP